MAFTPQTAAATGRKGGRSTVARYGTEHMRAIGRKGFAALARRRGYMGGSQLGTLQWLLSKGKLVDHGPDQSPAIAWAARVLDQFDPDDPEIPL
jgi:hypothetical protein